MSRHLYGPLYIATSNRGKLRELEAMVVEYFPQFKEIHGRAAKHAPETEKTFTGNALIKARALMKEITTENPELPSFSVLADDSGLTVDALNGAPGVLSARFAGDHVNDKEHIEKVLRELGNRNLSPEQRSAQYRCALALITYHQGCLTEYVAEGSCAGLITDQAKGESGFGYDPIFYAPSFKKTMSEISYEEKNSVSHRRDAFEKLKRQFVS